MDDRRPGRDAAGFSQRKARCWKLSNTAEQNRPADRNSKCVGEVGILTFHCSDNFGAMLQAYGLKRFLREHGVQADIVHYAPFFLTGRHWWLPYWPASGLRGG